MVKLAVMQDPLRWPDVKLGHLIKQQQRQDVGHLVTDALIPHQHHAHCTQHTVTTANNHSTLSSWTISHPRTIGQLFLFIAWQTKSVKTTSVWPLWVADTDLWQGRSRWWGHGSSCDAACSHDGAGVVAWSHRLAPVECWGSVQQVQENTP